MYLKIYLIDALTTWSNIMIFLKISKKVTTYIICTIKVVNMYIIFRLEVLGDTFSSKGARIMFAYFQVS